MKDYKIPEPTCSFCPSLEQRYGDRYCKIGKKLRRFKSKDPKRKVPAWCPRFRKSPIMRIYGFKNEEARELWLLFDLPNDSNKSKEDLAHPNSYRYKLIYEGVTGMSAKEFYKTANDEGIENLNDFDVDFGNVIEIDDGIKPYFFYYQSFQIRPAMFIPPERLN